MFCLNVASTNLYIQREITVGFLGTFVAIRDEDLGQATGDEYLKIWFDARSLRDWLYNPISCHLNNLPILRYAVINASRMNFQALFHTPRLSTMNAILLQTRGEVSAVPCQQCQRRMRRTLDGVSSPFTTCVRLEGFFGGCCSNCKWRDNAARCSFSERHPGNRTRLRLERFSGPRSRPRFDPRFEPDSESRPREADKTMGETLPSIVQHLAHAYPQAPAASIHRESSAAMGTVLPRSDILPSPPSLTLPSFVDALWELEQRL
ncbi:hypothetical protein F5B18DRAFT_595650 [Nemania serpens]|nr:hypothetical protein F5B18DRAFT_595650 [Nemania serpens]